MRLGKGVGVEVFSIPQFTILAFLHILAFYGIVSYFSVWMIPLFVAAHVFFCVFGISLGYHKYLSHRSFKCSTGFANFLATVATLCFQGGPIFWAASHRAHHEKTDSEGDPHAASRGALWSHFLWMCYRRPNGFSYRVALSKVPDLQRSAYFRFLEKHSTTLNVLLLGSSFCLCAYFEVLNIWYCLGPIRIVSVWHTTWLINSYSHNASFFGGQQKTQATNRLIVSLLLLGEGYHGNHHLHPSRANSAIRKGEFDCSFAILRALSKVGVVEVKSSDLKFPQKNNFSSDKAAA